MLPQAPGGNCWCKKVWSHSFIWEEALAKPWTNKQYPTPVMAMCQKTLNTKHGDVCIAFPCPNETCEIPSQGQKRNTFINLCLPGDTVNQKPLTITKIVINLSGAIGISPNHVEVFFAAT